MLMQDGTYQGVTKGLSPYYRQNGKFSVAVKVLAENDIEIMARINLEMNDGTLSDAAIKRLRQVFPEWDGTIDGLFIEDSFIDKPCSIVVENETNDQGKTYTNVKWLNPPNAGGVDLPTAASKAELLAKYGSKFRALSGGKSVAKSAAAPAPKAPEKKPEPAPEPEKPKKAAPIKKEKVEAPKEKVPTMEECWNTLCARKGDDAEALWEQFIKEAGGDKDYEDITGDEWIAIMKLCDGTNSME